MVPVPVPVPCLHAAAHVWGDDSPTTLKGAKVNHLLRSATPVEDPNVGALMGSFGVVASASSGVGAGRPFEESGLVSEGAKLGMP